MNKLRGIWILICMLAILTACGQTGLETAEEEVSGENPTPNTKSEVLQPLNSEQVVENSGDLIPDGVLTTTGYENRLTFMDTAGDAMREIETPGTIVVDQEDVAIAGPIIPDGPFPPVVYHSWQPERALIVNTNGVIETVRVSDTFSALASTPGQAALAFSEVRYDPENHPHGYLYVATVDNLESAPAFFDLVDAPFYWALQPVGVKTTAGDPQGVWYVKTAWGMGGADLIYPINRGLYFFDLTNGDNVQHLDDGRNFQGISPDLTFVAAVASDNAGDQTISVTNLTNRQTINFPPDPQTDRGAGWAVFSADNHYAAWLEASGSMISEPYDFQPRVRVGDIETGAIVQGLEAEAVLQVMPGEIVSMMRPVGWLDNETVLIEARGDNWDEPYLLRFEITSGTLSVFSPAVSWPSDTNNISLNDVTGGMVAPVIYLNQR